jgi:flagellar protein FlbD
VIKLIRLNKKEFVLNCEQIETIEKTPDTVITTVTGSKYIVADTVDEIIEKVLQYKYSIFSKYGPGK